jgi:hypothetical protein
MHNHPLRPLPLAIGIAACFVLSAASAATREHESAGIAESTIKVTSCNDAGTGSLREAIASAADGATIDLTASGCSEITLTTGEIHVIQSDLSIVGPGSGELAIKGGAALGYRNRIFDHSHAGTLSLNGLTLADAHLVGDSSHPASGGCIYSFGTVVLMNAVVTGCETEAPANSSVAALGGAVYSRGGMQIVGGSIHDNSAVSEAFQANGGGVFTAGNFATKYASIANNTAVATGGAASGGGGVAIIGYGSIDVFGSTISGNAAQVGAGLHSWTTGPADIRNSTISDNAATEKIGGAVFLYAAHFTNSTVTSNSAPSPDFGVGVYVGETLTSQSSIFANNVNVSGDVAFDVDAPLIEGNDNLIVSSNSLIPDATIVACPRLRALADNGGPTPTHAPNSGSPAIDEGNNHSDFALDQRSNGFPRIFGSMADIGAVEWQGDIDDVLFRSAFEVRCDPYD